MTTNIPPQNLPKPLAPEEFIGMALGLLVLLVWVFILLVKERVEDEDIHTLVIGIVIASVPTTAFLRSLRRRVLGEPTGLVSFYRVSRILLWGTWWGAFGLLVLTANSLLDNWLGTATTGGLIIFSGYLHFLRWLGIRAQTASVH